MIRKGDTGTKVQALQKAGNDQLTTRKMPWWRSAADGDCGQLTLRTAFWAAWNQGADRDELNRIRDDDEISDSIVKLITHKRERTAAEKAKDEGRRARAQEIRKHHKASIDADGDGLAKFDGVTCAAWIVPWLEKSRAKGWQGSVNSGYRTPEYSESLCYAMCGAPSCAGRCAGRQSNHSGKASPPGPGPGAVDVSDYYTFGRIQGEIGSPLESNIGPSDVVHFSDSGY